MVGKHLCFACCCAVIFISGFIVFIAWLAMLKETPEEPNFSLQQFYIPALNKTLNYPKNTTLYFELGLKNPNNAEGVYCDPINVTFFDSPNRSHFVGNFTIPNFYLGKGGKKATKGGQLETSGHDQTLSVDGSVVFRLDLATSVRYKNIARTTKRHRIMVGANVEVNDQGTKINRKPIRLRSDATKIGCYCSQTGALVVNILVLVLVFLHLW